MLIIQTKDELFEKFCKYITEIREKENKNFLS